MYRDEDGPTKPVAALNVACTRIPVHIVFGEIDDVVYVFYSESFALHYIHRE
jgi:hypothetical protein